jgi:Protein of unknown function (DUF2846)
MGCASAPMGDPAKDASLKTFKTPINAAGIYIYRNESIGAAVKMDVAVDGKPIGHTAANTYLYAEVSPGKHTITSDAENTSTLDIDAKSGSLIYIWQEVKMGFLFARNKLQEVSSTEGQKGVLETKLAIGK